jgi:HPt (histidine-containing phosphotransfer) domain-containing protein
MPVRQSVVLTGAGAGPQELAGEAGLPVWDIGKLVQVVGDSPATLRRFLAKYRQGAQELVPAIGQAVQQSQWQHAGELAHKLKSSALSVGALRLGEFCEAMERAGRAGRTDECTALAAQISQSHADAEQQMQQWMLASEGKS